MKKLLGAVAALAVLGGGAYGGWVYAGKPDLFAAMQGDGVAQKTLSSETQAFLTQFDEPLIIEGGKKAELDSIAALLPPELELVHSNAIFDAATGATTLKDVRIQFVEFPEFGLQVDELKVWRFDAEAFAARIRGERLDEMNQLAARIDARGIELTGLDVVMSETYQAYMKTLRGIEDGLLDGLKSHETSSNHIGLPRVNDYEFAIDRLIVDDLTLGPWELVGEEVGFGGMPPTILNTFKILAASTRMVETGPMLFEGTRISYDIIDDGVSMRFGFSTAVLSYSDFSGGDVDYSFSENMILDGQIAIVDPEVASFEEKKMVEEGLGGQPFVVSVRRSTQQNVRLREALGYLVREEFPDYSKTDLMSFGKTVVEDLEFGLNGQSFASIGRYEIDAQEFHWLIPANFKFRMDDLAYELAGFSEILAVDPDVSEEQREEIVAGIGVLQDAGIERLSVDLELSYTWDAQTGAMNTFVELGYDDFARATMRASGFLPNFDEGVAAIEADIAYEQSSEVDLYDELLRETEWETLLKEKAAFTAATAVLDDDGSGLDKMFVIVTDLGKLNPDEFGPMMTNLTPEMLRTAAVSAIGFSAIEVGKNFPPAEKWFMSFADWVRDGGKITAVMEPSEPIGQASADRFDDASPSEIADFLGISVTHEAP